MRPYGFAPGLSAQGIASVDVGGSGTYSLPARGDEELVEHMHHVARAGAKPFRVPPCNQVPFRRGRTSVEHILIEIINRLLLGTLRQPELARKLEVPHIVG